MGEYIRALVIRESLRTGDLPATMPGNRIAISRHSLDAATPIHVIEWAVPAIEARHAAELLAEALLTPGWYAHLVDADQMIVVFPGEYLRIVRGDRAAEHAAQRIGVRHGVPLSQMRFSEMFERDHPDLA